MLTVKIRKTITDKSPSSDVSETSVITINSEVANADAGKLADEEAGLAAEMFLDTSTIL
jgi:hypothetical protein